MQDDMIRNESINTALEPVSFNLHVNGVVHALRAEPRTTLAEALRDLLGMTGQRLLAIGEPVRPALFSSMARRSVPA